MNTSLPMVSYEKRAEDLRTAIRHVLEYQWYTSDRFIYNMLHIAHMGPIIFDTDPRCLAIKTTPVRMQYGTNDDFIRDLNDGIFYIECKEECKDIYKGTYKYTALWAAHRVLMATVLHYKPPMRSDDTTGNVLMFYTLLQDLIKENT